MQKNIENTVKTIYEGFLNSTELLSFNSRIHEQSLFHFIMANWLWLQILLYDPEHIKDFETANADEWLPAKDEYVDNNSTHIPLTPTGLDDALKCLIDNGAFYDKEEQLVVVDLNTLEKISWPIIYILKNSKELFLEDQPSDTNYTTNFNAYRNTQFMESFESLLRTSYAPFSNSSASCHKNNGSDSNNHSMESESMIYYFEILTFLILLQDSDCRIAWWYREQIFKQRVKNFETDIKSLSFVINKELRRVFLLQLIHPKCTLSWNYRRHVFEHYFNQFNNILNPCEGQHSSNLDSSKTKIKIVSELYSFALKAFQSELKTIISASKFWPSNYYMIPYCEWMKAKLIHLTHPFPDHSEIVKSSFQQFSKEFVEFNPHRKHALSYVDL